MSAPIHLYGPYYGRRRRQAQRAAHVLRVAAVVLCIVVGAPLVFGVLYAIATR